MKGNSKAHSSDQLLSRLSSLLIVLHSDTAWCHKSVFVLDNDPSRLTLNCVLLYCVLYTLCVYTGEPVVWAGGFHSQYGDLRLSSGRQAGQQQEHPETQILQTGTVLTDFKRCVLKMVLMVRSPFWLCWLHLCFCLFFQHCTLDLGSYIKDLSVVHDDLSSIVILDNSPGAYRSHPGKTQTCYLYV